jgi:indole-3-acetate monooxygenase
MASGEAVTTLLDAARAFRPRILASRESIEVGRRLPEDLTRDMARAGFFRTFLPAAYGGLDLTPRDALEVFEELARADASVAWCVWNGNVHWTTVQLTTEVAREIFADPDMVLANSTRPSGHADVAEGGYRVNGRWSLVSGCQLSAWFILMCIVHEGGQPRLTPSGAPESRFMFCPAGACQIIDTWSTSGLRGTGSHDVIVRELFVPSRHGSFFADPILLPGSQYQFPVISRVVPGLGAIALGIARNAIEALIGLAIEKRADERRPNTLREDRAAQARLSQAEALVRSARLFLFDAVGRLWDDVMTGGEARMDRRAEVRLASCHAVTSAAQAVDLVYLTGGATSLYESCPLERAFRDVHAVTQHIGIHPRSLETTGRVSFGLEPDTPPIMV